MSKIEMAPICKDGVYYMVKYRIRAINNLLAHRIPVLKREVIKCEVFQYIQRWKYLDTNERLSSSLCVKLNLLEKRK